MRSSSTSHPSARNGHRQFPRRWVPPPPAPPKASNLQFAMLNVQNDPCSAFFLLLALLYRICTAMRWDIDQSVIVLQHFPMRLSCTVQSQDNHGGWGGVRPFYVTCVWNRSQQRMLTIVHHNKEKRSRVKGHEGPGSYKAALTYEEASLAQVSALADRPKTCKQFIKYDCYHSLFKSNPGTNKPFGYWHNRAHQQMLNWGGTHFGNGTKPVCACHKTKPCAIPTELCNCDTNDYVWRSDERYLTDKENLPITEVRFGDTGNPREEGYHTVGPLICQNWPGIIGYKTRDYLS